MRGAILTALAAAAFVAVILVLMDDIVSRVHVIGGVGIIATALTLYGSRRALEFTIRHPHLVRALGLGCLLAAVIAVGVIVSTRAWPAPWAVALASAAFLSAMLGQLLIGTPASARKALDFHDRMRPGEGPGAADGF